MKLSFTKKWKFLFFNIAFFSSMVLPIGFFYSQYQNNIKEEIQFNNYQLKLDQYQLSSQPEQTVSPGNLLVPLGEISAEELVNIGVSLPNLSSDFTRQFEITQINEEKQKAQLKITTSTPLATDKVTSVVELNGFATPLEAELVAFENYHPRANDLNTQILFTPGYKSEDDFINLDQALPQSVEGVSRQFKIATKDIDYDSQTAKVQVYLSHTRYGQAQTTFTLSTKYANSGSLRYPMRAEEYAIEKINTFHDKYTDNAPGNIGQEDVYFGTVKTSKKEFNPQWLVDDQAILFKNTEEMNEKLGINFTELEEVSLSSIYDVDFLVTFIDFDSQSGYAIGEVQLKSFLKSEPNDAYISYKRPFRFPFISEIDAIIQKDYDQFPQEYYVHPENPIETRPIWPKWTVNTVISEKDIEEQLGIVLPPHLSFPNDLDVTRTYTLESYHIWNGIATFNVHFWANNSSYSNTISLDKEITIKYFKGLSLEAAEESLNVFDNYAPQLKTPLNLPIPNTEISWDELNAWNFVDSDGNPDPLPPKPTTNIYWTFKVLQVNPFEGKTTIEVTAEKNGSYAYTTFTISGFKTSFDVYLQQLAQTLDNSRFNLNNPEKIWWDSVASNPKTSEIEDKLLNAQFQSPFPNFEGIDVVYELIDVIEDNGTKPGYLKFQVTLSSSQAQKNYLATFFVDNFWNKNERDIQFDLNKFNMTMPQEWKLTKPENLPVLGQIIGTAVGNETAYQLEGLMFEEWQYQNFQYIALTNGVKHTYKVTSVDKTNGKVDVEVIFSKNGNTFSDFITISGFKTSVDDLLSDAAESLSERTFFLTEENRSKVWWEKAQKPSTQEISAKLMSQLFTTPFPSINLSLINVNYKLIDVVENNGALPGYIKIQATLSTSGATQEQVVFFKIANFFNQNELLIREDIAKWESLPNKLNVLDREAMPVIGQIIGNSYSTSEKDVINGIIFDWFFSNLATLPDWNPAIKREFSVFSTDSIIGEIVVKINIKAGENEDETYIVITGLETPFSKILNQTIDFLNNKVFTLVEKEQMWLSDSNLANKLNNAIFTTKFPIFDSGVMVFYSTTTSQDVDLVNGILTIHAVIKVGDLTGKADFKIKNFLTADEVLLKNAANQFFNYEGNLKNFGDLPQINQDISGLIHNWELNPLLPLENPDLTYTYTVMFANALAGWIKVQLVITKSGTNLSEIVEFKITGFTTSYEKSLAEAKAKLDQQVFTLANKEKIWESEDDSLWNYYLNNAIFKTQFPLFDDEINITYKVSSRNLIEGILTFEATIKIGNLTSKATFKVENFKTSDELLIENAINQFYGYVGTLTTSLPLPMINENITSKIHDWELDPLLPLENPDLTYTYTVMRVDALTGTIRIQLVISKTNNKDLNEVVELEINGFATSYQEAVDQAKDKLKNHTFLLANKEEMWKPTSSNELRDNLNYAVFTTQFPIFSPSLKVVYTIINRDPILGVLTIDAYIEASPEIYTNVTFKVGNFKNQTDVLLEDAVALFANYEGILTKKEILPMINENVTSKIHNWKLNPFLPIENTQLTYTYTVMFLNQAEGSIIVQVIIAKKENDGTSAQKATTFKIKGFYNLADILLENAYDDLNYHTFSLQDQETLEQKESIWDLDSSDAIIDRINNVDFKKDAAFPNLDSTLNIQYQVAKVNWEEGTMNFLADIYYQDESKLGAQFIIDNFKSNDDLMNIAFAIETKKLQNMKLIPKTNQVNDFPGFENTDFTIEWPPLTSYEIYSIDGKQIFTYEIERKYDAFIRTLNDQIKIDIKILNHRNESQTISVTFDNKKQSQMANIFLIAFGIQIGLIVIIGIIYLIRKRYVYVYVNDN